ncbi:hypothetical protein H4CHR_02957 [Variovorax sp. PBS-H4]|uniref:hypothetical protein n=1 Tax=Variovorax sp. PBS-H4 TaxID=434008 RepID=UPI001317A587|nr:hypothetical protein [Variovorax sp. PBS-H4]VTU32170.1 hypothetical protein H4CHR_02957 [Variovorax sp. PBS-H4]
MRDRATNLYITLGPSPLNVPLPDDDTRYAPTTSIPTPTPAPTLTRAARPSHQPMLSSRERYRQVFSPKPAPTTPTARLLHRIGAWISSTIL